MIQNLREGDNLFHIYIMCKKNGKLLLLSHGNFPIFSASSFKKNKFPYIRKYINKWTDERCEIWIFYTCEKSI